MREPEYCPHEDRILAARRSQADRAWAREHAAACPACRELLDVVEFVETLAASPVDAAHRLPDAGHVWWRAQLVRRWQAERRASKHLERMYPLEAGVLAASVIVFAILSWPLVQRWVASTEVGGATMIAASLLPAGLIVALVGGAVLLSVVSLLMMRDVLAE
jgi:hypothetical protein